MKQSYIVKSFLALSLVSGVAMAGDIETNDDNGKDMEIKSSVQLSERASEAEEMKAAKVGMSEVIATIEAKFSGKITKVELENEEGNLVYEAEVFQNDGKTLDIVVDAGTAQVLTSSVDKPDHEDEDDNEKDEEKED